MFFQVLHYPCGGFGDCFELRKTLAVIKYKRPPSAFLVPWFWQKALAEQKGEDLILITQISYFILLIKIPDKDLLQHFVALPEYLKRVVFGGFFFFLLFTANVV